MDFDTLVKCIKSSEVNNTRILSVQSMINLAVETLEMVGIDEGIRILQENTISNKITTKEFNYLIIFEDLGNDKYFINLNPYNGLYNKNIDDTHEYIKELRLKYGDNIPDIREIINSIKNNDTNKFNCEGISFNNVTYHWFDPQTLRPTIKKLYYTFKEIDGRKFIIGAGISLSRTEETLVINALRLKNIRMKMITIFIVVWIILSSIHYYIFRDFLFLFIITGIIGIFVLYIQILRPFASKEEPEIYDTLNNTLKAIIITSAGLIILLSRLKSSKNEKKHFSLNNYNSVLFIVFISYISAMLVLLINPRKQNIIKLHEINDILRVLITISLCCLIAAVFMALF
jgi:hypothetical protein